MSEPILSPLAVEDKLVHVVADIPEQVLCFGEAGLLCFWFLGFEEELLPLLVIHHHRTTVLRELLLQGILMAISEL